METARIKRTTISAYRELISYEYLLALDGATLSSVSDETIYAGLLPSEAASMKFGMFGPDELYTKVESFVRGKLQADISVLVNGTYNYPVKLRDAEKPVPLIYYKGDLSLIESRSISIVGARRASIPGLRRVELMAQVMAESNITVVSGLARGIDTAAMRSALVYGGRVIGVIGTPIDTSYPPENKILQDLVGSRDLLISQVPFYKYNHQSFQSKKSYFTERNKTMAAISDATVIIEASDTSGTLVQARACRAQGRPLFILKSAMDNPEITWPRKFAVKDPGNVHVIAHPLDVIEIMKNSGRWDG